MIYLRFLPTFRQPILALVDAVTEKIDYIACVVLLYIAGLDHQLEHILRNHKILCHFKPSGKLVKFAITKRQYSVIHWSQKKKTRSSFSENFSL